MKKINYVYEIRDGVYALGAPGKTAVAVASYNKTRGRYQGIRGRRPLLDDRFKRAAEPSKALREALTSLAGL